MATENEARLTIELWSNWMNVEQEKCEPEMYWN